MPGGDLEQHIPDRGAARMAVPEPCGSLHFYNLLELVYVVK